MAECKRPIAVIGAGFSGTIVAHHLLARVKDRRILLCEQGPTFARGTAYSTEDPVHLLNVRAENMSAFTDRPDHFAFWLKALPQAVPGHVHPTPAGTFVSRALYASYLTSLLEEALACEEGAQRFVIVPEQAVDLAPQPDGSFVLRLAGGRTHEIAGAVLAVGNLDPEGSGSTGRIVRNPWAAGFTAGLAPHRPVVIVGSGLTMVDIVMSLWSSGFSGPVVAISRRGLLPRMHVPASSWHLDGLDPLDEQPLSGKLKALRREIGAASEAGVPWQSVIDALRPSTSAAWRRLSAEQQARFLRHLRPWWDVHRHRMAPPVGQQIRRLLESEYLTVLAGRIARIEDGEETATVMWSPRGGDHMTMLAQRVIFATGAVPARRAEHTLLDSLIESGLVRLDRHGLGLDVGDDFRVIGGDGRPCLNLWAVGPIMRGAFWECSAVPDIRRDAEHLVENLDAALCCTSGRP